MCMHYVEQYVFGIQLNGYGIFNRVENDGSSLRYAYNTL